jgi:hypothetical protein
MLGRRCVSVVDRPDLGYTVTRTVKKKPPANPVSRSVMLMP